MTNEPNPTTPSRAAPAPARSASGAGKPAPLPAPNRDSVTTIRADGSRPFLYPADTHGRFTRYRRISAFFLIALYLSLPWIKIGGYPAIFLDLAERRFHLFGFTLAAQDLWLTFFLITGVGFSLFFVTALLGRVWCGWACPQTVFLDQVFRPIERLIDGDAVARRKLAAAPLTAGKALRRVAKHVLFIVASAVITHLFLAYFLSLPQVWSMMNASVWDHWSVFVFMASLTGVTYFNMAWFREQVCIVICPYGRIQSALIDDNSLVIGYDARRGEPRGKAGTAGAGDCVDCARCVHVCPTGIDIRQGLQLECLGCTACIDACDDVMARLKRPAGLIRYDSQNGFLGKPTRWLRPRLALYGVLLAIGAGVAGYALSTVRPANFGVTRITGAPYIVDANAVRNQFLVRIVNKRATPMRFEVQVLGAPPNLRQAGMSAAIDVPPLGEIVQPLVLQQERHEYGGPFHFTVRVTDTAHTFQLQREVEFLGPEPRLLREEEDEEHAKESASRHD